MNTTSGRTRFASATFLAPALAALIGLSAYPAQEARAFAADIPIGNATQLVVDERHQIRNGIGSHFSLARVVRKMTPDPI